MTLANLVAGGEYFARIRAEISAREAKLKPHVDAFIATGKPVAFKMRGEGSRRIMLLSKELTGEGQYRVTTFGPDGPHGHMVFNTSEEILKDLRSDTEETVPPEILDQWALTPEWAAGLKRIEAVRRRRQTQSAYDATAIDGSEVA